MIEKQVCSLELAKRLYEIGVKKESLFVWDDWGDGRSTLTFFPYSPGRGWLTENITRYSAFTVGELGEMLPAKLQRHLSCVKLDNIWEIAYGLNEKIFADQNEADARAKMLIHLIENKLINVEEINK